MTEARAPRTVRMKNVMPALCIAALACVSAAVANSKKEVERLQNCGEVLKEILDIPDNLPTDLLNDAECVIVIPSVKKFAMGIGGAMSNHAFVEMCLLTFPVNALGLSRCRGGRGSV